MKISLIAAISKNYVIGMDAEIPWKIPGEQTRFRALTLNKTIIMGRKTFESIGKPLPNRNTILVSRTQNILMERCVTVASIANALELVKTEEEVFIAGGGEIYKDTLAMADRIYLTIIDQEIAGNIYFPEFDKAAFNITFEQRVEGDIPYTFYTFERKS